MVCGEKWASRKHQSRRWHTTHPWSRVWHLPEFSAVILWEIVGDAKDAAFPGGSRVRKTLTSYHLYSELARIM